MDCGRMSDSLSSYIDGALPQREHMDVEKHLSGCADCRAELAALTMLVHAAGEIEAVEPPTGLRMRIAAATTAKPKAARGWNAARLHLQRILCSHPLRWAGGVACAAAAMVLFVGIGQVDEPASRTAVRPTSPAPVSTNVGAVRPAPVRTAMATSAIAGLREIAPRVRVTHASPFGSPRGITPAVAAAPKPKPVAKAKSSEERIPETVPTVATSSDPVAVDDTTVAQTVATIQVQEPAPEITDSAARQDRPALAKVASSPPVNKDKAEEWFKNMKTEAAMRRKPHSSNVMSVISARF